ncbi:hypothetical protein [Bradyrhizobium yuanmingense]|uniref:hypothetical protein n=1 Tax=Bradyrhizobium yuanmingense TaxID=108015 RepID=UPI0023B9043C|nr:hypothetical protein [Bradyrhizobium yuanmingense]MDF0578221.1 hypothetical protein [Bradyrhizobium yuanmingense]
MKEAMVGIAAYEIGNFCASGGRMAKGFEYRAFGRGLVIPTLLYVDDALLANIVLGEKARHWDEVRRAFERQGMPAARAPVPGLYYLPAIIKFCDRRDGIARMEEHCAEDGPDSVEHHAPAPLRYTGGIHEGGQNHRKA